MPDYEKMYKIIFNAVTDAIDMIDELEIKEAKEILKASQIKTEELYIDSEE